MLETKLYDAVPALDVSASYDAETQKGAVFLVNRSQTEAVVTHLVWQDGKAVHIDRAWQLAGSDPKEANSWDQPDRLVAKTISTSAIDDGRVTVKLPPLSFTALRTRTA
jgi:alpha-N-arabinofuranosidase